MPSHYTHVLFVREAYRKAFDADPPPGAEPWLMLGAQGPDPFFSGIRRQPPGEEWGHRLHREGFGRLLAAFVDQVWESRKREGVVPMELRHYVLAYGTHAILDREAHPWINYISGWVNPDEPDSEKYRFCHTFLERIIDMIMVKDHLGISLEEFDYPRNLPSRNQRETLLIPFLSNAIRQAFPTAGDKGRLEAQIRNAHDDNDDFLALTDPANPDSIAAARAMENAGELPKRFLALSFPREIPEGDFLNLDHRKWLDPRRGGEPRTASFPEMYRNAGRKAAALMKSVDGAIREEDGGESPGRHIADIVGDGDLNDGRNDKPPLPFRYSDPLPLFDLIDNLYV